MKPETIENIKKAGMTAIMIIVIAFIIWIPIRYIPTLFSETSKWVGTTLYSSFVPESTSTKATTTEKTTIVQNPTQTHYSNTQQSYQSYFGLPDLQISFFDSGKIDPYTKQFVQTNAINQNDEIAVRFVVKNIGTNISGSWRMRINMPSLTTPTYESPYQRSLKPGEAILFTSTFTNPNSQYSLTANIYVDPINEINESSKANNYLAAPILIATGYQLQNLSAYCYANPQSTNVGSTVNWNVVASGGNGAYAYNWLGTDNLAGNTNYTSKYYMYSGTKNATAIVTSNGTSVVANCNAVIY